MEGIFKKVLNFPSPHFYLRRMDEKVLTLYFIRGDPISFQIRKISSEFYFQASATYSCVT